MPSDLSQETPKATHAIKEVLRFSGRSPDYKVGLAAADLLRNYEEGKLMDPASLKAALVEAERLEQILGRLEPEIELLWGKPGTEKEKGGLEWEDVSKEIDEIEDVDKRDRLREKVKELSKKEVDASKTASEIKANNIGSLQTLLEQSTGIKFTEEANFEAVWGIFTGDYGKLRDGLRSKETKLTKSEKLIDAALTRIDNGEEKKNIINGLNDAEKEIGEKGENNRSETERQFLKLSKAAKILLNQAGGGEAVALLVALGRVVDWAGLDAASMISGEGIKTKDGKLALPMLLTGEMVEELSLNKMLQQLVLNRRIELVHRFLTQKIFVGQTTLREDKKGQIVITDVAEDSGSTESGLVWQDILEVINLAKEHGSMLLDTKEGSLKIIDYNWLDIVARLEAVRQDHLSYISDLGKWGENELRPAGSALNGEVIARMLQDPEFIEIINDPSWYPKVDPLTGKIEKVDFRECRDRAREKLKGRPAFKIRAAEIWLGLSGGSVPDYNEDWIRYKIENLENWYKLEGQLGSGLLLTDLPEEIKENRDKKKALQKLLQQMTVFTVDVRSYASRTLKSLPNPEDARTIMKTLGVPWVEMDAWDLEKGGVMLNFDQDALDLIAKDAGIMFKEKGRKGIITGEEIGEKLWELALLRRQKIWQTVGWKLGGFKEVPVGEEGGTDIPFGYTRQEHIDLLVDYLTRTNKDGSKTEGYRRLIQAGLIDSTKPIDKKRLADLVRQIFEYKRKGQDDKEVVRRNHLVGWLACSLVGENQAGLTPEKIKELKFEDLKLPDISVDQQYREELYRKLNIEPEYLTQLKQDTPEAEGMRQTLLDAVKTEFLFEDLNFFEIATQWKQVSKEKMQKLEKEALSELESAGMGQVPPNCASINRHYYYLNHAKKTYDMVTQLDRLWRQQEESGKGIRFPDSFILTSKKWKEETLKVWDQIAQFPDIGFQVYHPSLYAISLLESRQIEAQIYENPRSISHEGLTGRFEEGLFQEGVPLPFMFGSAERGEDFDKYREKMKQFLNFRKQILRVILDQGLFVELASNPVVTAQQVWQSLISDRMFHFVVPVFTSEITRLMEQHPYYFINVNLREMIENGQAELIETLRDPHLIKGRDWKDGQPIEVEVPPPARDNRYHLARMLLVGGLLESGSNRLASQLMLFAYNHMKIPWDELENAINQGLFLSRIMKIWDGLDNMGTLDLQFREIARQLKPEEVSWEWAESLKYPQGGYNQIPQAYVAIARDYYGIPDLRDRNYLLNEVFKGDEEVMQTFINTFMAKVAPRINGIIRAVWGRNQDRPAIDEQALFAEHIKLAVFPYISQNVLADEPLLPGFEIQLGDRKILFPAVVNGTNDKVEYKLGQMSVRYAIQQRLNIDPYFSEVNYMEADTAKVASILWQLTGLKPIEPMFKEMTRWTVNLFNLVNKASSFRNFIENSSNQEMAERLASLLAEYANLGVAEDGKLLTVILRSINNPKEFGLLQQHLKKAENVNKFLSALFGVEIVEDWGEQFNQEGFKKLHELLSNDKNLKIKAGEYFPKKSFCPESLRELEPAADARMQQIKQALKVKMWPLGLHWRIRRVVQERNLKYWTDKINYESRREMGLDLGKRMKYLEILRDQKADPEIMEIAAYGDVDKIRKQHESVESVIKGGEVTAEERKALLGALTEGGLIELESLLFPKLFTLIKHESDQAKAKGLSSFRWKGIVGGVMQWMRLYEIGDIGHHWLRHGRIAPISFIISSIFPAAAALTEFIKEWIEPAPMATVIGNGVIGGITLAAMAAAGAGAVPLISTAVGGYIIFQYMGRLAWWGIDELIMWGLNRKYSRTYPDKQITVLDYKRARAAFKNTMGGFLGK